MAMEAAQRHLLANVSRESRTRLEQFVTLLLKWQQRMNLVGSSTIDHIWDRHVNDSLQLLPLLPPATRVVADLGSGAGFPGLVLALAGDLDVHLFESNGRKISFLREAIRLTGCKAQLHAIRLETLSAVTLPRVDVVTSRALAPLMQLLEYAEPFLAMGATGYFHKGERVEAELTEATKYWRIKSVKHPSVTDSKSAILEVKEAIRAL